MNDSEPVGRIAAFAPVTSGDAGHIGFFESVDQPGTAAELFAAAESWLGGLGRTEVTGPVAINPRDQIGLVVDGFDRPATVLTPYNPAWYRRLFESAGYVPAVHLRSYAWTPAMARSGAAEVPRAHHRGRRSPVRLRPLDRRRLAAEARIIAELVNAAFNSAWEFPPVTAAEATAEARALAAIVDPSLVWFAEDDGVPVGVAVTVPDPNWLSRRIGGRLLPFGWLAALRLRRRIPWARFMVLAVRPGRRAGATALRLMVETHRALVSGGYEYAELAQVFDDNATMRGMLERIGAPVVRRFAVFRRHIA